MIRAVVHLVDLPLHRKLLWIMGAALALSVFIAAIALIVYDLTSIRPRATRGAEQQAAALANVLIPAVEFDDRQTAQEQLDMFARQPGVLALVIVLADGVTYAEHLEPGAQPVQKTYTSRLLRAGSVMAQAPLDAHGRRLGTLYMTMAIRPFSDRFIEYISLLGGVAASLVASTLVLLVLLRRAITKPMEQLALAAQQVAQSRDYRLRVPAERRDEIGQLAARLNEMLAAIEENAAIVRQAGEERESLEAQLRQSQKMQALGTLAGGIAHDFNNMLAAITGNAKLALQDLPKEHPAVVSLEEICRAAQRAKDLVRRILAFSRHERGDQRVIDLKPVIDEALRLLRSTVPAMIEIRSHAASNLPHVLADATQVHQALMNLGTNAADAMRDRGGVLTVTLESVRTDSRLHALCPDLMPGLHLRVRVADTGTGIPRDVMERIFDPFFTTKARGEGTGLGLSVVHGIMQAHHGAVMVDSEPGHGAVFDLYFPAAAADAPAAVSAPVQEAPRGRGEHVLYVDDEEALVFLVKRMMERMGYRITGVQDASAALAVLATQRDDIDLVISDLNMPGMSGLDLAAQVHELYPDLPIIITTGYARDEDLQRAKSAGVRDVVLKPGTVEDMAALIRRRLEELHPA